MLKIQAYGRISTPIDIKQSKDKKHLYTNFLLASHSKGKTTFIRCVGFDAMATLLHEYFSIGDRILLNGILIEDRYKEGNIATFKIQIQDFEFIETKEEHNKNKSKHKNKEEYPK